MGPYVIELEVAGPLAMFARPDTGGTPTSYPVPTWSAAKGLFEAVAYLSCGRAWICPTKVEICRTVDDPGGRVRFQRYTNNYGGPLRKASLCRDGSSMQVFATVLSGVCYRLHAVVAGSNVSQGTNLRHYLKDLFDRRLRQGRCYRTPCLGWSEFTCSYWGPFREGLTSVDTGLTVEIPSMLLGMWDRPGGRVLSPIFRQNVAIKNGVLHYDVPEEWLIAAHPKGAVDA